MIRNEKKGGSRSRFDNDIIEKGTPIEGQDRAVRVEAESFAIQPERRNEANFPAPERSQIGTPYPFLARLVTLKSAPEPAFGRVRSGDRECQWVGQA
jgi:hypothetical protein